MHYLDYNEKKQHGTMDFPIEYYHVDEHHPRYNMPLLQSIRLSYRIILQKTTIPYIELSTIFSYPCSIVSLEAN